ncbi:MAG: Rdx family protein [Candidatus Latescibacteria bacterium]|nr:Rdx family protein [Candidatus Latescibacterota bacterium]
MTRHLLEKYKTGISRLTLVPSGRGRFEITADGETVFSKLKEGRFPEDVEIESRLAVKTGNSGSGSGSCCPEDEPVRRKSMGFRSLIAMLFRKAG